VNRSNSPEARPGSIEGEFGIDQKPGYPIADNKPNTAQPIARMMPALVGSS
jgi:hypothetical protein